jgi:lactoylglutathione lyase
VTYVNLALERKGVTRRPDGIRQIYFQDPDGHWLEINDANADP